MIPKMMYCKSRNFQWCFIFGNFGADNFYRKNAPVPAPLPGKRVLPTIIISLHRTTDFGEFRKYYTTENFCFYSTQIGSMEILHDLWFMQLVIADLTHWPQAWVSQAMLYILCQHVCIALAPKAVRATVTGSPGLNPHY